MDTKKCRCLREGGGEECSFSCFLTLRLVEIWGAWYDGVELVWTFILTLHGASMEWTTLSSLMDIEIWGILRPSQHIKLLNIVCSVAGNILVQKEDTALGNTISMKGVLQCLGVKVMSAWMQATRFYSRSSPRALHCLHHLTFFP